jgi:hypothetical protein
MAEGQLVMTITKGVCESTDSETIWMDFIGMA